MANYYKPGEKINWLELPKAYPTNIKRQEKYKWYKPILVALLAFLFFLVLAGILFGVLGVYCMSIGIDLNNLSALTEVVSDPAYPIPYAIMLLILIVIIPSYALAMKICGFKGLGCATSIDGKMRWDRIKTFLPLTLLALFIILVVQTITNGFINGWDRIGTLRFLPVGIIITIVLVPLQCAAEEYLCRSFLLQTFSSWIPIIVIPLFIQAIIFGCMHSGQYDVVGVIGCGFMGLCAGYIAIKTGGIEGGIVLHACNNVLVFLQACLFAVPAIQYSYTAVDTVAGFVVDIFGTLVILWLAKKHGMILKADEE